MNKLKNVILTTILLMVCCQVVLLAETSTSIDPRDALVLIIMRSLTGRRGGSGFVIGDGTLVVTAHHLVFEKSEQGRHKMAGLVSVVSPYLGDGCEAGIVAVDEELDLAVLRIPWSGHPALKLADEDDILSAERLVILGLPEIVRSIGSGTDEPLQEHLEGRSENLPVDYVAARRRIPRFISLGEIGQLGDGWSGSPMLLPDSDTAAGCFTTLQLTGDVPISSRGPAVTQARRLLKQSGREQSLVPSDSHLPRREDGTKAFLTFAQAYHHYLKHRHKRASDKNEEFITMRPESSLAYLMSASNADVQGDSDPADQYYRKAITLHPEGAAVRFFYAQFLSERRPDEALEILDDLWELDELKPFAALLMVNILSERGQFQRAGELLTEASKLNPRNAYLWMSLAGCHLQTGKHDEAIESVTRTVVLLPEIGPFRGKLARLLVQAGRLDEAEKHFRELLKIEPNNPIVHLWLAQFLAKHRPAAMDEALKEAQNALELPPKKSLPREKIEQIIQEIRSQTAPTP